MNKKHLGEEPPKVLCWEGCSCDHVDCKDYCKTCSACYCGMRLIRDINDDHLYCISHGKNFTYIKPVELAEHFRQSLIEAAEELDGLTIMAMSRIQINDALMNIREKLLKSASVGLSTSTEVDRENKKVGKQKKVEE